MDSLPYELLEIIVDELSLFHRSDLLRIRAVNKTFCALATPRVFACLHTTGTAKDAIAIWRVVRRTPLAECVKSFFFLAINVDTVRVLTGSMCFLEDWSQLYRLKYLAIAFYCLHRLTALESLKLAFYGCNAHDGPDTQSQVQRTILSTILRQPPLPRLKKLHIVNMAPFHDPMFDLPSFRNLFISLESLCIMTHHGRSPQRRFRDSFVKFWQHAIQRQVFNTLASHPQSLTQLILHSDIDVGIVTTIDFSQLYFPALRRVSLNGFLFNEETHVEEFIVGQRHTLRKLSVSNCNIAIHDPIHGPPRFWSQIYTRFADALEGLANGIHDTIFRNRYAELNLQSGYSYDVVALIRDEDEEALTMFNARIASTSKHVSLHTHRT
ncbi:hypothetical protein HETIRDRAFT_418567 [Heterobasidion irregulare TC 32-1]|uniref:F-box domain-containing protein n=1 Tax=Heterobasidion irregulare (strain TC 32-1) TaxID=747525 RepID=W4K494_HETIT|nr:uncharacterized protein HETIRDRAFT_418567 [Heterobasidion irregulare TC 32-1]ETW80569.1 hypothetical protein HETIRDRAFT_418567 [Heterobasidion irregulare TC 32-1]